MARLERGDSHSLDKTSTCQPRFALSFFEGAQFFDELLAAVHELEVIDQCEPFVIRERPEVACILDPLEARTHNSHTAAQCIMRHAGVALPEQVIVGNEHQGDFQSTVEWEEALWRDIRHSRNTTAGAVVHEFYLNLTLSIHTESKVLVLPRYGVRQHRAELKELFKSQPHGVGVITRFESSMINFVRNKVMPHLVQSTISRYLLTNSGDADYGVPQKTRRWRQSKPFCDIDTAVLLGSTLDGNNAWVLRCQGFDMPIDIVKLSDHLCGVVKRIGAFGRRVKLNLLPCDIGDLITRLQSI